jgi:hypothetical protein
MMAEFRANGGSQQLGHEAATETTVVLAFIARTQG